MDYPKQGIPVILDDNLPRPLIRCSPDWHAAEVVSPRKTDYYESSRALGYMFRAIHLEDDEGLPEVPPCTDPMSDPITLVLFEKIRQYLSASAYIQLKFSTFSSPTKMNSITSASLILCRMDQKQKFWRKRSLSGWSWPNAHRSAGDRIESIVCDITSEP